MQDDSDKSDEANSAGIFKSAMSDVAPLKPDNKVHQKPVRRHIRSKQPPQSFAIEDVFSDEVVENCPEQLSFSRGGVQPATLKKLRQGKLAIDTRIDLHGMIIDEARGYLREFLGECELDGSRVILIVHGKGYSSPGTRPVIKPLLNRWLKQLDMVLAFSSAQPKDGGTGALYVLLRK